MSPRLQTAIRILIALGALAVAVLALRGVDLGRAIEIVLRANLLFLVLTVLVQISDLTIRVIRWKYALLPARNIPFLTVASPLFISFFVGNITFTGAGAVPRVYVLTKKAGIDPGFIAGTIAQEFLLDATAITLFATITPFFVVFPPVFDTIRYLVLVALVLLLAINLAVVRHQSVLIGLLQRLGLWDRILCLMPGLVRDNLIRFGDGLGAVFFHPKAAAVVVGATFLIWITNALVFWFLMLSLNIPFTFIEATAVMAFTNAVITVIVVPGFIGTLEASSIGLMLALGADRATALAFTILLRVFFFLPSTTVGAIFALREGFRAGRDQ